MRGRRVRKTYGLGIRLIPQHIETDADTVPDKRRGAKRARPAPTRNPVKRLIGRPAYYFFSVCFWILAAISSVFAFYGAQLPSSDTWSVPDRPPNVRIIDQEGNLIANRGKMGGEVVRLAQMPPFLPQAVVAIEDRRFFSHFGIDPISIVRAAHVNFRNRGMLQGGSTITQQLAKNLFLTPDRTLGRKIQEVILALWLEANYTKAQILEMYMNRVYFGGGAYGVEAAARGYFHKSARNVTLGESAVLAGLLKAPSRYSPKSSIKRAGERAKLVLQAMVGEGFITAQDAALAFRHPVRIRKAPRGNSTLYAADWAMERLPRLVSKMPEDVIVETTLDRRLQFIAETALKEAIATHGPEYKIEQAAFVLMDRTGQVRALVGGKSYRDSQFNRAVRARRQPGSAFKPFVYLTALEAGYEPESIIADAPVRIGRWTPSNYGGRYAGNVTLRTALMRSINTVPVRLTRKLGAINIVDTASRLGIRSRLNAEPSIALGTSEVSLVELVGAYAALANGGWGVRPHVVSRVFTRSGRLLYEHQTRVPGRLIREEQVGMMNSMLRDVVDHGTGRRAKIENHEIAGKTGTSQRHRDAWFIGYTGHFIAGVWMGNDRGVMSKVTGGQMPAMLWKTIMSQVLANVPPVPLPGKYTPPPEGSRAGPGDPLLLVPSASVTIHLGETADPDATFTDTDTPETLPDTSPGVMPGMLPDAAPHVRPNALSGRRQAPVIIGSPRPQPASPPPEHPQSAHPG